MAQQLCDDIAQTEYYSGFIDTSTYDDKGSFVECRLVASLIIYRSHYSAPEGDANPISNIVPVWCECKIFVDGEEQIHDFDIEELKNYLCVWE